MKNFKSIGLLLGVLSVQFCGGEAQDQSYVDTGAGNNGIIGNAEDGTPTALYIFDAGITTGAMGGREGADQICKDAAANAFVNESVHAFLSVSPLDSIALLPYTFGLPDGVEIKGWPSEDKLANSWSDFLDGDILVSNLSDAGVASGYFWSGSNSAGELVASYNCNGFTTSTGNGMTADNVSEGFLKDRSDLYGVACSSTKYHLLCVGHK